MSDHPASPASEKVPGRLKLILSLGEFAPSAAGTVIPFYFLFFLTDIAGVRPGLAGTLLLVARLWDAINDPLVGNISDRTHSRWGRRRPFILFAMLPMGLFYALLWVVPPFGPGLRALYYLIIYLLFDTAFTFVQGPYAALTPELTLDADERTSLFIWRMAVSIITGLVAAVGMDFAFSLLPNMRVSFALLGVMVGALSVLPYIWIVAAVRERPEFQRQAGFGLGQAVRVVLRSRPYLLSLSIETLAWTTIAIVEAVFTYYLIYWSGIPQEDSPVVLALILASATLTLPLVNWLANRFDKKWAFVASTSVWVLVHIALWFVPQMVTAPIYVIAGLAGLGVAAAHVLPGALSVDVLEAVEMDTGQRQEGLFVGISAFGRKLGTSAALFVLGWVLDLTGYVPNAAQQTGPALLGIRLMLTWVPIVLLGLAIAAAAAFPITRAVHADLVARLAERRAAASD